jgi:hypothetical protein
MSQPYLIPPHSLFTSPWAEQEKNQIEAVQKKAINWIPGLVGASYEDKCSELGLSTLEERRWEQDMVQVYKILHGHGGLKFEDFFRKRR